MHKVPTDNTLLVGYVLHAARGDAQAIIVATTCGSAVEPVSNEGDASARGPGETLLQITTKERTKRQRKDCCALKSPSQKGLDNHMALLPAAKPHLRNADRGEGEPCQKFDHQFLSVGIVGDDVHV